MGEVGQKRKLGSEGGPNAKRKALRYCCNWSGEHAFDLDADLDELPMRRTDQARIVDTDKVTITFSKAVSADPEPVLLARADAETGSKRVERQQRYILGKLPIAYRAIQSGKPGPFIYVIDDAVTQGTEGAGNEAAPVPPCVVLLTQGAGVVIDVADRGDCAGIIKVRTDEVLLQLTNSVANEKCNVELLDYLAKALAVRRSALSVVSGRYKKQKVVQFAEMSREAVYNKLISVPDEFKALPSYNPAAESKKA